MAKAHSKLICWLEKPCRQCGVIKPLKDFHRQRVCFDGWANLCKACKSPGPRQLVPAEVKRQKRLAQKRQHRERSARAKGRELYLPNGKGRNTGRRAYAAPVTWEKNARQAWVWWLNVKSPPEWRRLYINAKNRHKYATQPEYALYHRLKRWMRKHLRSGRESKIWSSLLGYTIKELHQHLERQFHDGMGWQNMGQWHIDHIRPVSSFTFTSPHDEDFKQCYALSNLQPLWATDNMKKGRKHHAGMHLCQNLDALA